MELMNIAIESFPAKNSVDLFDINSIALTQIYHFFKNNPRGIRYRLSTQANTGSYVDLSAISTYAHYGISLATQGLAEQELPYALLVIPEEKLASYDTFIDFIDEESRELPEMVSFSSCIVEMNKCAQQAWYEDMRLKNNNDCDKIIDILTTELVCHNNNFIKEDLSSIKTNEDAYAEINRQAGKELYKVVKVDHLFKENNCFNLNYSAGSNSVLNIVSELTKMADKNIVFMLDSVYTIDNEKISENTNARTRRDLCNLWICIAAYLTLKTQANFDIPEDYESQYLQKFSLMAEPHYNYCGDYLNLLANFPDLTINHAINFTSYCILHRDKINTDRRRYGIDLVVCSTDLDNPGANVKSETLPLEEVNVIPITDYFDLHTYDYEKGTNEMRRLEALLRKFEEKLNLTDNYLHVGNVFLMERNSTVKLTYLAEVRGTLPFICLPIVPNYGSFSIDFSVQELPSLLDIRTYKLHTRGALAAIGSILQKPIKASEQQIKVGKNVEGVLLYNLLASPGKNVGEKSLTFDTVGIWGRASADLRGRRVAPLTTVIPLKGLCSSFLSYFGGPHPAVSNKLWIRSELWR